MNNTTLRNSLEFIKRAENLKNTLRCAFTSQGRTESVAEHTWRLCLMTMLFADEFKDADLLKMLKMCVIHDLGEAIHGDIPATAQDTQNSKSFQERNDLQTLMDGLSEPQQQELLALWDEYEHASSHEARLVKGLDKLETLIQHNQGQYSPSIDYNFNLSYGQKYMDAHPLLSALRHLVNQETAVHAQQQKQADKPNDTTA